MPKKVFKISSLDKGIIGNASKRDIPADAMSYGENVDSRVVGKVRGIPDKELVNASFDARVMTSLLGDANELIGQNSSRQFKSYDIDGDTVSNIGSATTNFARSMVAHNKAVYAGMSSTFRGGNPTTPKWIGTVDDPPFNTATAGDQVVVDAECKSFADQQNFSSTTSPLITLNEHPGKSGNAALPSSMISLGSDAVFETNKNYFWAISLIYDGYQESPLIMEDTDGDRWDVGGFSFDATFMDIIVKIGYDAGDFPERVTGINIYRAEGPAGANEPTGEYRHVKFIDDLSTGSDYDYKEYDITLASAITATDGSFEVSSADHDRILEGDAVKIDSETVIVSSKSGTTTVNIQGNFASDHSSGTDVLFGYNEWLSGATEGFPSSYSPVNKFHYRFRDNGSSGATYEDNTGVPQTLESTSVNYSIAAEFGSWLFIGDCDIDDIGDAEKYVFRSKPKTYSIIDWSSDFLQLPESPKALAGFGGRLYAFSGSNTYRINPAFMQIEDDFLGVGALNENMVAVTNFGMFHADENNIYINDGRTSRPIGTPILENQWDSIGWTDLAKTVVSSEAYASMRFDPVNRRLLIFASTSTDDLIVWAYDVEHQRWDYYPTLGLVSTMAVGPSGTMYAVIGDTIGGFDLYSLFTSSTRKNWKVRTKDFDFDSDSGFVFLYDISASGDGNLDIGYYVDEGSTDANPTVSTSSDSTLRQATVKPADKKSRSIVIEVASAATTDTLDNLTIQYRLPLIQE